VFLVDYHIHPYSHGEENIKKMYSEELLKSFILEARKREINEIGFSDHDELIEDIDWKMMKEIKEEYGKIKLGIEFDFSPDKTRLKWIKNNLKKLPLDYSIGSVHFIEDWAFDHPDYIEEYQKYNIDELYCTYFDLLKEAVSTGLFQVVGHLDLIKIFGFKPKQVKVVDLVTPVLKEVKKRGMVIEINTNGLNKPVKEIYPSINILKMAYKLDIPVTLGSDAHEPQRTGENIKMAARIITDIGYSKIAVFNNKEISLKEIDN
jgi:histidinol-phosphatase (PHP family)